MRAGDRRALIGDIGGTHARFAICDVDELSVTQFVVFQTWLFSSLQDAIRHYLDSIPDKPKTAGFAIAGDVFGNTVTMARAPWSFTRDDIAESCGVKRIHFVSDFEAEALALPYLNAHDLATLQEGDTDPAGNMLVLGPGSGFGCAALIRQSDRSLAIDSFAGHMGFSAANVRETAVLKALRNALGYAPLHDVLSARGLEAIYRVLTAEAGMNTVSLTATDIARLAGDGEDAVAEDALDCFAAILARIAGDMALAFNARGGVFLGGGVSPKILRTLRKPAFQQLFRDKGDKAEFLESLPLKVMLANDAGLRGAALAVSERYPMQSLQD
ncbi:ROK family protein [Oricola sp.]|uniref:glucokinase n=1 Tax=Oricola sp. TaxID=1979950 RepID=UPI003BA941D6